MVLTCGAYIHECLTTILTLQATATITQYLSQYSISDAYIPYSLKFSRVKIFEDFKGFCLTLNILISKFLVLLRHLLNSFPASGLRMCLYCNPSLRNQYASIQF